MLASALITSVHGAPFDVVADTYDDVFTNSLIGRAQRAAVWRDLDRLFSHGQRVLELNCGTGVDAVHLASRGVEVLACDASPRMIEIARQRASKSQLRASVDFQVLPTEELGRLQAVGQFDGVFSNFAGLNCVSDLPAVARNLSTLVRPGGAALFCMFGAFCAWESLWYLARGNARKAFRRLRRGSVSTMLAEGAGLEVRYPSVQSVIRAFAPDFRLIAWKGVGVAVPPSYVEPLARRFPTALKVLARIDPWLGRRGLLRRMADHMLLEFERARL